MNAYYYYDVKTTFRSWDIGGVDTRRSVLTSHNAQGGGVEGGSRVIVFKEPLNINIGSSSSCAVKSCCTTHSDSLMFHLWAEKKFVDGILLISARLFDSLTT